MDRRQIGCLTCVIILLAWVSVTLAQTVPEEARRYMARGMAAVEMAKTPKDYERAVREFEQAAKLAPNWPDVYFNLGSIQTKAGNYGEAMRHYKRYLELAPGAPDAAKVREEIYKLEYRAEEEARVRNRFIANSNGTVLDTQTGLMWAARDNGVNINWANAKSYCENYRGGGYSDWRMPTLNDLAGLYDASKSYKTDCVDSVDVHLTELIHLTCTWVWTSETRGSDAETAGFLYGRHILKNRLDHYAMRALPVRSAKLEVNNPLPGSASVPDNTAGGYIGITLQKMTDWLAESSGLNKVKGVFVLTVDKNSPAGQAGLKSGDIILSFDGKEVNEVSVLPPIVAATPVGKTVDARIYRDGKEQTVKVKIGNRQSIVPDSEKASAASSIAAAYKTGAYKGVRTYENGDKYEGEFTDRKLNGKGKYTYANGDQFIGEFVDGKFTSKGTFTCSNGKQFTGNLGNKVPLEFTIRCN